jgi:three-Cys-motif partner protein
MSDPILWQLDDHTRAKHRVLKAYLDAWIPVMGQQAMKVRSFGERKPRLLLVDGFAGPGRYRDGEPGSPLIMLNALAGHKALPKLMAVQFTYLFIEKDRRRVARLRDEVDCLTLPRNAQVRIEHGAFEMTFRRILDEAPGADQRLAPTFAFIDPFGYAQASMSLAGRILDFPRSEALFFLPLTHIARFVGEPGQEPALTSLFDTDEWRDAIPLPGDKRHSFLLSLFEAQLARQGQVAHVQSFALRTRDGNDYRLVFATGHERGLELMKRAMWSVDPERGTQYAALTHSGQTVLFQPSVDTKPLLTELRSSFGRQWFTVADAERITRRTLFLVEGHLKKLTLRPAAESGELEVERPPGRRADAFTSDVRLRFR